MSKKASLSKVASCRVSLDESDKIIKLAREKKISPSDVLRGMIREALKAA